MPRVSARRPVLAALFFSLTCGAPLAAQVSLQLFTTGFDRVSTVTHAGDGSGRLFVVERKGPIRVVRSDGSVVAEPFLDLTDDIASSGMERGVLGLAFAPDYAQSGAFFVAYTDPGGDSVVARYSVSDGDPDRADPDSASIVLVVPQPTSIHNVHHLAFGPDGMLWIGSGDGGGPGDPDDNAQNLGVLLGKLLRIDVGGPSGYSIPPDNPFVGVPGVRPEIWAYGLRNPADFHFDRADGDLLLNDVGQDSWEEVNHQPASSGGGENYGWKRMEGRHCFDPPVDCEQPGFTGPIFEYAHADGDCAVVGGIVVRDLAQPSLSGRYLFGDFCSGRLRLAAAGCEGWSSRVVAIVPEGVSAIGEDEAGRVYIADWSTSSQGSLWRLETASDVLFSDGFETGAPTRWSACVGWVP